MSHTVPSQQSAVVLRTQYQHLRALLAIAAAVILGLTAAVVVLATNSNHTTLASPTAQSATHANASAETGAKLDHSGRNTTVTQTTGRLANYPDAPPLSAGIAQPSVSNYPDAPPLSAGIAQPSVSYYPSSGTALLTPEERGYAQAIAAMSRAKQAAAFGIGK